MRGGSSGGSVSVGGGGMKTLQGAMMGAVTICIGLIMIALAMTTISDMLDDNTITWASYPGATQIYTILPMLMGVGIILFGGVLALMGMGGKPINIREAILTPIVAIVMVILAPIMMDFLDSVVNHADKADYTGLNIFTLVPMLWAVIIIFLPGVLGYLSTRGSSGSSG